MGGLILKAYGYDCGYVWGRCRCGGRVSGGVEVRASRLGRDHLGWLSNF